MKSLKTVVDQTPLRETEGSIDRETLFSAWEARLLIAILFGFLGIFFTRYVFLSPQEVDTFVEFLRGQIAWSPKALASVLFWKMLLSFAGWGAVGYVMSFNFPEVHLRKARVFVLGAYLFLIPTVLYVPSMSAEYIWDDDQEVSHNPTLRVNRTVSDVPVLQYTYGLWEIWTGGITNQFVASENDPWWVKALRPRLQAIEKAVWTKSELRAYPSADYFPLKSTLLWLEFRLFGDSPYGYHVVTILFHALNTVLLWRALVALRIPGAWVGALLFGIHPVHAESVAWISELKNTLSLAFLLWSFLSWIKWEETRSRRSLGASLALFLASMLCKTSVVMFPVALLIIAWWRTGLKDWWPSLKQIVTEKRIGTETGRTLVALVPYFLAAGALSRVTVWFQNTRAIGEEVIPIGDFWSRMAGAGLATWWYFFKAICPVKLTTIYPRFDINPPHWWQFLVFATVPVVLAVLFAEQKRWGRTPFLVAGFFVAFLFPVMGFFRMSYMRLTLVADHFQYLSDIAIVAAAGALIALGYRSQKWREVTILLTSAVVVWFSAYTWERSGVHLGPKTLWTDALKHNWNSWQAQNHMGAVIYAEYMKEWDNPKVRAEKLAMAHMHFKNAVELNPANPEVHNNYGLTLNAYGHWQEALKEFRRAVEIKGDVPAMRRNLAELLASRGMLTEALKEFRHLVEVDRMEMFRPVLVTLHFRLGQYAEVREECLKILKNDPNNVMARKYLDQVIDQQFKGPNW